MNNNIVDNMLLKIKNAETSLYMFRTIDRILKKRMKSTNNTTEMRAILKRIVEDSDAFLYWQTLITRKYPMLTEWCLDIQSVYIESFNVNGLCKVYTSTFKNENDIYMKMYKHFLNIFFINIKMFLTDGYELTHTLNKINNAWLEFLIVNIEIKPIIINEQDEQEEEGVENNSIQVQIFE